MGSSDAPTMVETKFSLTKMAEDGRVMGIGIGAVVVVAVVVAVAEEDEAVVGSWLL